MDLGAAAGQEGQVEGMRIVGLECLSWCLGSMVEWMTRRDREGRIDADPDTLSEHQSFTEAAVGVSSAPTPDEVLALKKKKEACLSGPRWQSLASISCA